MPHMMMRILRKGNTSWLVGVQARTVTMETSAEGLSNNENRDTRSSYTILETVLKGHPILLQRYLFIHVLKPGVRISMYAHQLMNR